MKELYRVEHMTRKSYDEYMSGGYNYTTNKEDVLAENAEEAVKIVKAMFKSHVINDGYVKTVAELEAEEAAREAEWEAARKKEAERKAKKEAFEKAHPEIVAERKRKAKITRAKRTIKELETQIAEAEKNLIYWKARLEEFEKG
jgi:hypothetical protein